MEQFIRIDGELKGEIQRSFILNLSNIAGIHVLDDSKSLTIFLHRAYGQKDNAILINVKDQKQAQAVLDFFEENYKEGFADLRDGYAAPEENTEPAKSKMFDPKTMF